MKLGPLWAAALVALCACPEPQTKCKRGVWGSADEPPELDIGMRGLRGAFIEVQDGDEVDLEFPVQGGHVFFVGARLRNMAACDVDIVARVKNPTNGQQYSYEARPILFATDGGTGVISDLEEPANAANIPMCPNYTDRDLVGQEWDLEVTATDIDGRTATATRRVRPACRQPGPNARAECLCECQAHYYFGKCGLDGGFDAGP
jgi:hypothetical protein